MVSYVNTISEFDNNNNSNNNNSSNNNNKKRRYYNSQLQDSSSIAVSGSNPTLCSICKSNEIITDAETGEIICSKCGQVISENIQETGPEWRSFSLSEESKDTRSRIGMPTSLA